MIVVCKRATKRLIKGHRYQADSVSPGGSGSGRVFISGVGSFSTSLFTTVDGEDIPNVRYNRTSAIATNQPNNQTDFESLRVGDILVCKSDRYKTFVKNGMYKIEKLTVDKLTNLSLRQNGNSLEIPAPGAKAIKNITGFPSTITITITNRGTLLLQGSMTNKHYVSTGYQIQLDGHETIKGTYTSSSYAITPTTRDASIKSVKFVGIPRKIEFKSWVFRKLSTEEARSLSLGSILGEEETTVITSNEKRNIELVGDKDDVLLKNLAKAIIDGNRHHLSIVEWAALKVGDKLQVVKSDYDPYLNMTLGEILEKIK